MAVADQREVRIRPVGDLTESAVSSFLFELDEAVLASCDVIVDLAEVTRVSPGALEALAEAQRYLRERDCVLRFENPIHRVWDVLDALGFAHVSDPADQHP